MESRVHNFSAGPGVLPLPVLEEIQEQLLMFSDARMSVLELSHRSRWYNEIYETAVGNIRALLDLPDNYHVLFLQGGATAQFSTVAMSFLHGEQSSDYIVTGDWGKKAVAEAQKEGKVRLAWDGSDGDYTRLPRNAELDLNPNAAYLHFTSNETIRGVEYDVDPDSGQVPLVCDASSDILSRPIDVGRYGLIYAGAQKNMGPAGTTLVIVRDDMLARIPDGLPVMFDYRTHVAKKSAHNTPPVFAVYAVMLVTKWLREEIGGLEKMALLNRKKANLLYELIDESGGFYHGFVEPGSRSLMNITFRLPSPELDQEFVQQAETHDLMMLKGYRTMGGIRASVYNAMPLEGVHALRDFMREFMASHG